MRDLIKDYRKHGYILKRKSPKNVMIFENPTTNNKEIVKSVCGWCNVALVGDTCPKCHRIYKLNIKRHNLNIKR